VTTATRTLAQSEAPITTTDSRPVPDPTTLTTQQLSAAIAGLRDVFEVRLKGMDKAIDLLQETSSRSPTLAEIWARHDEKFIASSAALKGERDISDQKFLRVDQQFIQIEKLAAQLKIAGDTAVAAALQAQKEAAGEQTKSSAAAISKSEAATGESIKQLQTLFNTSISGLVTQIADLKSRLDKGEGGQAGQTTARADVRTEAADSRGQAFGIIGVATSVMAMVLVVLLHFLK
jgi:hypothetical protein